MAPSVKPAARLSERPLPGSAGPSSSSLRRRRSGCREVAAPRRRRLSRSPGASAGSTASSRSRPPRTPVLVDASASVGQRGERRARPRTTGVPRQRAPTLGPQIRRGDPPNLSISISGGRETNQDSPSNGERSGNSSSRQSLASIASELWPAEAGAPDATPPKLTWKGTSERVIAPCAAGSRRAATVFGESGCLGVQPKVGGKLHLKPNSGTRPIANKYREGKVKSTLERELKRPRNRWEGNACSRTGPRRVQGVAGESRVPSAPNGSTARRGSRHPCTLGVSGRPSAAGSGRGARVGQVTQPPLRRRTYSRPRGASGARRGERWHFHPRSAGRFGGGGARVRSAAEPSHCLQWPAPAGRPGAGSPTTCAGAAWLDVGRIRPVLKHGPRSATVARAVRVSKPAPCAMKVKAGRVARRGESRPPGGGAPSTDPLPRRGGIRVRALLLRPERW